MDKIIRSISADGNFRAFALDSTETVREAQALHDTIASSTVALGRTLMAAQILGEMEKGDTKITVKVLGDGEMGPILAVADSVGNVKGYVKNTDLDYRKKSTNDVIVAPLVGNGFLVVIKDMGLRQAYTGQVELLTAEIAEDLAWYFVKSEQTPSSVGMNVSIAPIDDPVNPQAVLSAKAFILQALPGASDEEISKVEANIKAMPALSTLTVDELLPAIYGDLEFKILDESPLAFNCDCSRERFSKGLKSLGQKELTAMIEEDHGAEVVCQFCNKKYQFSENELNALILEGTDNDGVNEGE